MTAAAVELDRLVMDLQRRAAPWHNSTDEARGRRTIDSIGNFMNWCCGTATDTELHTLSNNEETVNKHLNSIQDVVKDDHMDLVKTVGEVRNFSSDISRALGKVRAALSVLESNSRERVSSSDMYSILLTHVVRLQSQLYSGQTIEIDARTHTTCRNNMLPSSLVPEGLLLSDLEGLAHNISSSGYEIALPLTELSLFYALPITSCKFSPQKILITVKIPIKKSGERWSLYEYVPSPVAWRNFTCSMALEPIYVARSEVSVRTIVGLQRETCDPGSSGMCLLPRQRKGAAFSSECAARLMEQRDIEDLRGACPFYCSPSHGGVIVTQVAAESYVITHPSPNMVITCSNLTLTLPIDVPGAVEVTLGCDCSLTDGAIILISRQFPCFSGTAVPSVYHVLPAAWTSLSNVTFDPFLSNSRPVFQNFSHILDLNWTVSSPTFMVHQDIPPSLFEHVSLPETWWDISDLTSYKYIAMFGWLAALSVLLGYICFKMYILNVTMALIKAS